MAEPSKKNRVLFVGLGSPHGDDQVGWRVAESLRVQGQIDVRQAAIPADLLHWLDHIEALYLCDACRGRGTIGSLHRWAYRRGESGRVELLAAVARLRSTGSHNLGLGQVLDLAERLGILPEVIVLWAVEGGSFGMGQPLSSELKKQLPGIVHTIEYEINHARKIAGEIADPASGANPG